MNSPKWIESPMSPVIPCVGGKGNRVSARDRSRSKTTLRREGASHEVVAVELEQLVQVMALIEHAERELAVSCHHCEAISREAKDAVRRGHGNSSSGSRAASRFAVV